MRDDLRARLDAALAAERPFVDTFEALRDDSAPGDRFLRDFLVKAERVVVPAMVEVGRWLEGQGRFYAVERSAERRTPRGLLVPAAVQMSVFRRHRTVNFKNGAPFFSVACDRVGRRVLFRRRASCAAVEPEDVGACALDALTRARVEDGIAALLDAMARG